MRILEQYIINSGKNVSFRNIMFVPALIEIKVKATTTPLLQQFLHPESVEGVLVLALSVCESVCLSHYPGPTDIQLVL